MVLWRGCWIITYWRAVQLIHVFGQTATQRKLQKSCCRTKWPKRSGTCWDWVKYVQKQCVMDLWKLEKKMNGLFISVMFLWKVPGIAMMSVRNSVVGWEVSMLLRGRKIMQWRSFIYRRYLVSWIRLCTKKKQLGKVARYASFIKKPFSCMLLIWRELLKISVRDSLLKYNIRQWWI